MPRNRYHSAVFRICVDVVACAVSAQIASGTHKLFYELISFHTLKDSSLLFISSEGSCSSCSDMIIR